MSWKLRLLVQRLERELGAVPEGPCSDPEVIGMIVTGYPATLSGPTYDDILTKHIVRCEVCFAMANGFIESDRVIRETQDHDVLGNGEPN